MSIVFFKQVAGTAIFFNFFATRRWEKSQKNAQSGFVGVGDDEFNNSHQQFPNAFAFEVFFNIKKCFS